MSDKDEENSTVNENTNKSPELNENPVSDEGPQSLEGTVPDNSLAQQAAAKGKKIEVLLKATGDAPIISKKKWVVNPDQTIGWISEFIRKLLKLGSEDRLFLYINQTFAPAPDQTVKNLFDCYGTDGKLIIHYCKSQAWG